LNFPPRLSDTLEDSAARFEMANRTVTLPQNPEVDITDIVDILRIIKYDIYLGRIAYQRK
jgi:hypothetical protein